MQLKSLLWLTFKAERDEYPIPNPLLPNPAWNLFLTPGTAPIPPWLDLLASGTARNHRIVGKWSLSPTSHPTVPSPPLNPDHKCHMHSFNPCRDPLCPTSVSHCWGGNNAPKSLSADGKTISRGFSTPTAPRKPSMILLSLTTVFPTAQKGREEQTQLEEYSVGIKTGICR